MTNSSQTTPGQPRQARPSDDAVDGLVDAITRLNADGDFLARAITDSLLAERPVSDESRLSTEEVDFLIRSGSFTAEKLQETSARLARGELQSNVVSTLLSSLNDSLSADDVEGFLELSATELDELIAAGGIYSVEVAGRRRFPSWQFSLSSQGKLLPHLAEIIGLVKDDHWISVSGMMHTPQANMVTRGRQTPVEWFRSGGGIEALRQIKEGQKWR